MDPLDQAPSSMSRRKLVILAAGAVFLGLIGAILARQARAYEERTDRDARRDMMLLMAEELRSRATPGADIGAFSPTLLMGAADSKALSSTGEYAIAPAGHAPDYAGTRFVFSLNGEAEITLTVQSLAQGQWEFEEFEMPSWWQVWK